MTNQPLPADYPLTVYRGDTRIWDVTLERNIGDAEIGVVWDPVPLDGHTFDAEIRMSPDDPEVMAEIDVEVLDAEQGKLRLTMTAVEARKLLPGRGYWDLEVTRTADGFTRTYLAGKVAIKADVSR